MLQTSIIAQVCLALVASLPEFVCHNTCYLDRAAHACCSAWVHGVLAYRHLHDGRAVLWHGSDYYYFKPSNSGAEVQSLTEAAAKKVALAASFVSLTIISPSRCRTMRYIPDEIGSLLCIATGAHRRAGSVLCCRWGEAPKTNCLQVLGTCALLEALWPWLHWLMSVSCSWTQAVVAHSPHAKDYKQFLRSPRSIGEVPIILPPWEQDEVLDLRQVVYPEMSTEQVREEHLLLHIVLKVSVAMT